MDRDDLACALYPFGTRTSMKLESNKRGAGKGGMTVPVRAGRAWPALPDRESLAWEV